MRQPSRKRTVSWTRPASKLLVGLALLAPSASGHAAETADEPGILVGYSFEEQDLETGPDTFRVFEAARGTVDLTQVFRLSGYHSVEIRDVAADGDFPELQGYFDLRASGWLYAHFALLLTDASEELNVALAGPQGFRLARDGISFWLSTYRGYLVHFSDSMPKRLFEPRPFVWYHVDLAMDLDAGRYDLQIQEEGIAEPLIELWRQPNAAAQPGSAVDKFSFIGDRGQDLSSVVYYVDDVMLGVDETVERRPFVAPGRRRLFVDALDRFRETVGTDECLPAIALEDFGIDEERRASLGGLSAEVAAALLANLDAMAVESPALADPRLATTLRAAADWREGCRLLGDGRTREALERFARAGEAVPRSRLYESSYVLALVREERWSEVDEWMSWLEDEWSSDPRFAVLAARVGSARGDLSTAEASVRAEAERVLGDAGPSPLLARLWTGRSRSLTEELQAEFPDSWPRHLRAALVPTQYFYVLLWQERYGDARDYALALAALLERHDLEARLWLERAGDAAFYARDLLEAARLYERCLRPEEERGADPVLLKLSDVRFLQGDREGERALREAIYGRLAPE